MLERTDFSASPVLKGILEDEKENITKPRSKDYKSSFDYSKSLLIVSFKIIFILICVVFFMMIINLFSESFLKLALSIIGILEMTIIFLFYNILRKKINAKL